MSTTAPLQRRRLLGLATGLGALNALWALFQWAELLLARQGATPFCALDETFNCTQVWDSPIAVTIHDVTQVPVAGWGLIWGIVATLLPLIALVNEDRLQNGVSAGLRLTAIGGMLGVAAFATASALSGALCIGCIGTYVAATAWSFVAWRCTGADGFREPAKGIMWSAGLVLLSFAVLFVPGTRTPHAVTKLELPAKKPEAVANIKQAPTTAPAAAAEMWTGPATGDPVKDDLLEQFVTSLDDDARQNLADVLSLYRVAPVEALPEGRDYVVGTKSSPLRIVEWTDPLCPHCAMLHATIAEIAKSVPPGSFAVESRHFPLDGFCNSGVQRKSEDGLRCVGAKAQICLEGNPKHFEATAALFEKHPDTVDGVYEALKGAAPADKLKACVAANSTKQKLDDDIALALRLNLEGTPLVYLNGREVNPYGPAIYALVLTGGKDRHPAFRTLPAPRKPDADGHQHPH